MNQATGTMILDAPIRPVRDTLLAATRLPEWNPAFVRVSGIDPAVRGAEYALEAIRGLRGKLTYTQTESYTIAFSWEVPLLSETGLWQLAEPSPGRTLVTHTVERRGALAMALVHTLGTLPGLRLERLSERLSGALGTLPSVHE
ncbi:SRPBCC family protein [Microbacterium tumbae]